MAAPVPSMQASAIAAERWVRFIGIYLLWTQIWLLLKTGAQQSLQALADSPRCAPLAPSVKT
jgi:hypothetical protein